MDSTQAAQVNQVNAELGTSTVYPPPPVNKDLLPAEPKKQESLLEIKARFLNEAKKIDVLAPLRDHPWTTVGGAAILGAVAGVITSAFAKPKVIVYHDDDEKKRHEKKKQEEPKGKAASIFSTLKPLLLKAGQTAATAWLAKRQTGSSYDNSMRGVDAYE